MTLQMSMILRKLRDELGGLKYRIAAAKRTVVERQHRVDRIETMMDLGADHKAAACSSCGGGGDGDDDGQCKVCDGIGLVKTEGAT